MGKKLLKLTLVVGLVGVALAFRNSPLYESMNLAALKANSLSLREWYARSPWEAVGAYFLVYILITSVSLPGAGLLTITAGALFGLGTGTLVASFASAIGATLAFLLSRFLFRDAMAARFRPTLERIDRGVQREGAFYLFSLRLIPIFPFFVINAVMGLTRMKVLTFFLVSQIGMLLGTIAFVNAGTQLAQIESLRGILSPKLLLSFAILGILPFVAKRLVDIFRSRKAFGNYRRPRKYDYNVLVIGAGSGGLVSSYIAAAVRAKVGLIEKHKMGGDCLNTGCVPSKALIRTAKVFAEQKKAKALGLRKIEIEFDFAEVMARIQKVIRTIEPHDSISRYTDLGVECITGTAKIVSPWEVEVNGKRLSARNLIVATGSKPFVPPIPGLDKVDYLTSDNIWDLRQQPKRLAVLGGGVIGCELAQCFARMGTHVIQIERNPRILPREDDDVSALITEKFRSEGIEIRVAHSAKEVVVVDGKKILVCDTPSGETRIEFDEILLAIGRRPNTTGFGLEELGVTIASAGNIENDEFLCTNVPSIYVCGDVAGPFQFTHTASHQAWYASVNSLFGPFKRYKADYSVIPWCNFTDPEVARVGLSEMDAKQKGIAYEIVRYGIDDLDRAITDGEAYGFVKVLTEPGRDKILGVTIAGAHAGEIIVEYVTAMKFGIGLNKILGTIHIYPTFGEANKYAAGVWKRAHAPEGALRWLAKFHAWRRGERFLPF